MSSKLSPFYLDSLGLIEKKGGSNGNLCEMDEFG